MTATSCDPRNSFYLLTNGLTIIENGWKYCGSGQYISTRSSFNGAKIAHTASYYSGLYQCNFTAIQIPCDCGAVKTVN